MDFASRNRAAMRNANPPGHAPTKPPGGNPFLRPETGYNESVIGLDMLVKHGYTCDSWNRLNPKQKVIAAETIGASIADLDVFCRSFVSSPSIAAPLPYVRSTVSVPFVSSGAVGDPAPSVAPDGRVSGIDGMLAQVSEALVHQVSLDHEMQVRIGTAAGVAVAETVLTGMFIGWVVKVAWNALPER